jgi:hypothetical protein
MTWLRIETAPFDRNLEVAVINFDGAHPVAFPCRRTGQRWTNAATAAPVEIQPTHWREWDTVQQELSALSQAI